MRLDIRPAPANALGNLQARPSFKSIILTWTLPVGDPTYAGAEVWMNSINDRESGTKFAVVAGNTMTIPVTNNDSLYFWIRAVNQYGRSDGPFTGPASAAAQPLSAEDTAGMTFDFETMQILGKLSVANIDGLGALATLGAVDLDSTQVYGALAADKIGAGQLAAGVIYGGRIAGNQIDAVNLSAITALIGTLRTRASGGRLELRDDVFDVYGTNGVNRVKIGNTL